MAECALRTSAFEGSKYADSWIEVYHSRISWTSTLISYKKDTDDWVPFGKYKLLDAHDVRPGFRAFRIRAQRLEFLVRDGGTGGGSGGIESRKTAGDHAVPHVVTVPGRYVLSSDEKSLRSVGSADTIECLRQMRSGDKYVEILYHSSAAQVRWRKVYIVRAVDGKYTTSVPMQAMSSGGCDVWFHRCLLSWREEENEMEIYLEFAFTDGNDEWDEGNDDNDNYNDERSNYRVYLPGKYRINGKKKFLYLGPSDADLHLNK